MPTVWVFVCFFVLILWDAQRRAGPMLVGEDGTKQGMESEGTEKL